MRCSSCGAENPEGLKFCNECAAPLKRRCIKCGFENAPAAKFCGECAAALAESASHLRHFAESATKDRTPTRIDSDISADGERKTVTALFADIKGSMELMEDLDREEARAIVDPALKLMIEAVHRYDGYIVQSTGDGIFALFGAPLAHEDHPQRALYSALRMQEELRRYSARLVAEGGIPIQCRVGANTGEVVVRSISTGQGHTEYTPIGHTANLASRMQAVAPVGSIAVSQVTHRLCEGYFILRSLGPTRVRGLSEPVNVYEVTGLGPLRTRLQRAAGRGLTKFVGRQREMEVLKHALERAQAGHGQIVAAIAEPGVGKSRLFFEFKAISQSGCMALEAFSVSHGKASAYSPVIDLLHGYFRITGEDDERTRREKVAGKITILDRALEDALPYLFSLLSIVEGDDPLAQMDGQVKKRRTLEAIKRILLRESINQPLLVIFEDLHWIDEQTQELLNLLADSIGTAKILLMVSYRPEYSHQWGSKTYYTQLRLDPLGHESAEEMLNSLIGEGDHLAALKRLIIEKTEGTPFFMEETAQALFEEGVLERNGSVKLTRPLAQLKIPPTVLGLLASRIDRLPSEPKGLLQTLAVIGREFPLSLIRAVVPKSDDELDRLLNDLQLGEFVYEQPAVGDTEYIFKHALTQEVASSSVLFERRKQLHERIGAALETLYASSLDDHLAELAHHYGHSGSTVKAVEYLYRAAQQALRRSANVEAVSHLTSALELLKIVPDSRERTQKEIAVLINLGASSASTSGFGTQEMKQVYSRAAELCRQIGETSQLFFALMGLWQLYLVRAQHLRARELGEQLLVLALTAQDSALLLAARRALGESCDSLGELSVALDHFEQGIALYDPRQHRALAFVYGIDPEVYCLSFAAFVLWTLGFPDQALQKSERAVALAEQLSHPVSLCAALYFAALLRLYLKDGQAAAELAQAAIALSTQHGSQVFAAGPSVINGWALAESGRNEAGIALMRQSIGAWRSLGMEIWVPFFNALLAKAPAGAGDIAEGQRLLADALGLAEKTDEHLHEAELYRVKGELTMQASQSSTTGADGRVPPSPQAELEAEACFLKSMVIARSQSARSYELRATMSLARLLAQQGRRAEARALLAEIYNWFTEGFDTADLKEAKALLDELSR